MAKETRPNNSYFLERHPFLSAGYVAIVGGLPLERLIRQEKPKRLDGIRIAAATLPFWGPTFGVVDQVVDRVRGTDPSSAVASVRDRFTQTGTSLRDHASSVGESIKGNGFPTELWPVVAGGALSALFLGMRAEETRQEQTATLQARQLADLVNRTHEQLSASTTTVQENGQDVPLTEAQAAGYAYAQKLLGQIVASDPTAADDQQRVRALVQSPDFDCGPISEAEWIDVLYGKEGLETVASATVLRRQTLRQRAQALEDRIEANPLGRHLPAIVKQFLGIATGSTASPVNIPGVSLEIGGVPADERAERVANEFLSGLNLEPKPSLTQQDIRAVEAVLTHKPGETSAQLTERAMAQVAIACALEHPDTISATLGKIGIMDRMQNNPEHLPAEIRGELSAISTPARK